MLLPSGRGCPPALFISGGYAITKELSIFVDESGGQKGQSRYCIVSLIFHEQSDLLEGAIASMEQDLRIKGLPNIPFHASPLMYGKGDYEVLDMETRKRILASFEAFCRHVPFRYKSFSYRRSEVFDPDAFIARFERDFTGLLTDNLKYFQAFDVVKIYYDNGQPMVTEALHRALDRMLSKEALLYKAASPKEYRLFQVADYVCAIALVENKYLRDELTETDAKIFGTNYSSFKRNHLKHIRRKEVDRKKT